MTDPRKQAPNGRRAMTLSAMKVEAAQSTMMAADSMKARPSPRQIAQEERNNQRTMPRTLMQPSIMS